MCGTAARLCVTFPLVNDNLNLTQDPKKETNTRQNGTKYRVLLKVQITFEVRKTKVLPSETIPLFLVIYKVCIRYMYISLYKVNKPPPPIYAQSN